jgi:tryptophanyl-tRNA synthetase
MRVFSGIRPSGHLHLGNYFGAIHSWLELQKKNECFFSIADLHAITTPYQPKKLKDYTRQTAVNYLSLGIDPQKSTLFVQSTIPQHSELAWILATIASVGELKRMTQYKTKIKELGITSANAALLEYPLLMASDILLYQTNLVPVGKDQQQHVELTRDLARRFNQRFGPTFVIPETMMTKQGLSIKGLQHPQKKMSKSSSAKDCLFLTDSPQEIKKKIQASVTDTGKEIRYNPDKKPGISNLINIYSLLRKIPREEVENLFSNKSYRDFKEAVSEEVIKALENFQQKRKELLDNPEAIDKVLEKGEKQATKIAKETMNKVRKNLGLY